MDKSYIFLKSPIGLGGEANIYTVRIKPELVAKIYHQPHGDYARKLAFMIANPPVDPLAAKGLVSIAWATELVTDLDRVVGFLMPKLDTSKAKPIFQYYNPATRRKETPWFSYVYLLRTAKNLARAVNSVHSRGYVIGDVNESNILVSVEKSSIAIVTLVDTDSFQVNDGNTVYRCTVGKPEYTPPELQGVSFRDVDRSVEHDLFGLGVLIYQLLMEGTHPFGGVFTGQGEAPELKDRIKAGHFPHSRCGIPYKPMPLAPSFQMLPVALQELFLLCFEQGQGNPAARPTADVWSKVLGEAEDGLVTCGVNGQHHYSGHLGVCPWCERAAKLGGRDPFPSLGVISSGQHLKPAAIGKAVGKTILKAKYNPTPTYKTSIPNPATTSVITSQVVSTSSQNSSQPSISANLVNNNSQISPKPTAKSHQISSPSSTFVIANSISAIQVGSRVSEWRGLGIIFSVYLITGIFLAFTKQNAIVWGLIVMQTIIFSLSFIIKSFLEILSTWLKTFILILIGIYVNLSTSFICLSIFNPAQLDTSESRLIVASGAVVLGIAFCMGTIALIGNAKAVIEGNTLGFIAVSVMGIAIGIVSAFSPRSGFLDVILITIFIFSPFLVMGFRYVQINHWSKEKFRILRMFLLFICIFVSAYSFIYMFIPYLFDSSDYTYFVHDREYVNWSSYHLSSFGFYILTSISAMSLSVPLSAVLTGERDLSSVLEHSGCMFSPLWLVVIPIILFGTGTIGFGVFLFGIGLCVLSKTATIENKGLEKQIGKWKAKLLQLGICLSGLSVGLLFRMFFVR